MSKLLKSFLIVLLLSSTAALQAQRLKVGINFIPGITQTKGDLDFSKRSSFSAGFIGVYKTNAALFSLQSGLLVSDKGYKIRKENYITINKDDQDELGDSFFYSYYLTIPFLVRLDYKSFYAAGGISYYSFLRYKSVMKSEPEQIRKGWVEGPFFARSNFGFNLQAGFQHQMSSHWQLFTELRLNTLNDGLFNSAIFSYYLNYELGFGLLYTFSDKH